MAGFVGDIIYLCKMCIRDRHYIAYATSSTYLPINDQRNWCIYDFPRNLHAQGPTKDVYKRQELLFQVSALPQRKALLADIELHAKGFAKLALPIG